jgi:hypothetical protein
MQRDWGSHKPMFTRVVALAENLVAAPVTAIGRFGLWITGPMRIWSSSGNSWPMSLP